MSCDFLKLNGRTYALAEVAGAPDMEAKIKEYHELKAKKVIESCADAVVGEVESQWNTQLDKLRERYNENSVLIPPALHSKMTYNDNTGVYPLRTLVYAPTEVRTSWAVIKNYIDSNVLSTDLVGAIPPELKRADSGEFIAQLKPVHHLPLAVYLKNGNIYGITRCGFHFYGDNHLCTGNTSGLQFWNSPLFESNINRINTFSLANRNFPIGSKSYYLAEFINGETIQSIASAEEGASAWRTT